jgi:hypothetical protein
MKGATAEPCVKAIKPPNEHGITVMGNSQNFFCSLRNFDLCVRPAFTTNIGVPLDQGEGAGHHLSLRPLRDSSAKFGRNVLVTL